MNMRTLVDVSDTRPFVSEELSDDELEHVVGGLARPWDLGARPVHAPVSPAVSVSLLDAVESVERMSA
jgi:bacteriocin-like protein